MRQANKLIVFVGLWAVLEGWTHGVWAIQAARQ